MLRRAYDAMIRLSAGPHAGLALGMVSFAESSFFPLPPDIMLIPMVAARPERAWFYALVCTLTSVAGGVLGYAIGAVFYDSIGQWIIGAYGYHAGVEEFRSLFAAWGAWIILLKGLTPIPYKLVTIASGFAGFNLPAFIALSLLTRGARFFILAGLLNRFGLPLRRLIERHLGLATTILVATVIGGMLISVYLV